MGMHTKLFRDGQDQAVRIPREFELPGEDVVVSKVGDKLIIEPEQKKSSLLEWLATLEPLDEDFPEIPGPPTEPEDIF